MKKRSLSIDGHRTSVSLEDEFWIALKEIASKENVPLVGLIKDIDESRSTGLSSAIRCFVLRYYTKDHF